MPESDVARIRALVEEVLDGPEGDEPAVTSLAAAVPGLCDEVEQLRGRIARLSELASWGSRP